MPASYGRFHGIGNIHNYKRQSLGICVTLSVLVINDLCLVINSTLLCEADDTVLCDW